MSPCEMAVIVINSITTIKTIYIYIYIQKYIYVVYYDKITILTRSC